MWSLIFKLDCPELCQNQWIVLYWVEIGCCHFLLLLFLHFEIIFFGFSFPKIVNFLSKQLACTTCGSCKHSCQLLSLTDFWSRWLPWKRSWPLFPLTFFFLSSSFLCSLLFTQIRDTQEAEILSRNIKEIIFFLIKFFWPKKQLFRHFFCF